MASRRKILVFLSFVILMVLVMGMLAVPTGVVSAEITAQRLPRETTTRTCHECLSEGHRANARHGRDCGAPLPRYARDESA